MRSRSCVAAAIVLVIIVMSALLAPLIAPFSPSAITDKIILQAPSFAHIFGTDELGRDLFSRTLYGGRVSLLIGLGGTALGMGLGVTWGAVAAMGGTWLDEVVMRAADAAMAIPILMFALMMAAAIGPSELSLMIILGLVNTPIVARWTRAAVKTELGLDYVLAARASGASKAYILRREVYPNIFAVLIATAMITAASVILLEATLSFLGLGVPPPAASWGTLVQSGYGFLYARVTYMLFPGVMIVATLLALSVLAARLQTVLGVRG